MDTHDLIDKIRDELYDSIVIDMIDRIYAASLDETRPEVDKNSLKDLQYKIEEAINEAAQYEI